MSGRSSLQLQTQSPPLFSAPPTASPPLLQRPASNPPFGGSSSNNIAMQLTNSTSPSLFDVGAAAAPSSAQQPLAEAAIVHSFLAFSPSPPTSASQSAAASQADEHMTQQTVSTATLQQSQAHQQQPQTQPQSQQQQQQPPAAQVPQSRPQQPQQQSIAPSLPAPFLVPLFSPSPTLDGHALALRPAFDLHADLFSPPLHHSLHHQLQSQSSRALMLLDVSSPPPMPAVPRNSPSLAAAAAPFAAAASPASSSLASGSSPSPRLHHPRPLQHSPLQRYAAELEVAEFFHSQNQLSEQLAMEIESIQRRRQMRERMLPHMELPSAAPTSAAASPPYHPRTAHIAVHYPTAAVAAHAITRQMPPSEYTLAVPVAQRLQHQQQFAQQRPVLATLVTPAERAARADAQHHPHHPHQPHSTSLPRNRRVMAPIIHVPHQQVVVAQEILSPPSSSVPAFRLSTSSAASAQHHTPALPAIPHVPVATRAAPMARVTPRSIVSPQRSPAPSMQYTRAAAAAAAASSSHAAAPVSSFPAAACQGAVMMEDTRPPDSGGSNSVASLGSVAAGRRSMSRALSPLEREFLSPPALPSIASSSAAASVAGSASPDLVMTRRPRAAAGSKRKHCDWPGCTSHFAKLSALIRHRRVHTKEKPFVCEHDGCTAAFSEKGNLVRHEEEMHADHRNFACPFSNYCTQRFRRAAHLEQHLAARHTALGEDIAKPWLFHAPPEEQPQTNIKRKWRAATASGASAGTKKEAASAAAASSTAASSSSETLPRPTAPMLPFSFASSSAASRSDLFLLPPSGVSSASSDLRFVINTAAVEAAAAAAAAGSSNAPAPATMPLQRVRVQSFAASQIKTEPSAAAAAAPAAAAASVPAGSKRRLAVLSPPQPVMSDSSSSSESSLPLLVAMDALHLPPSAIDAADNAAPHPRSPRPKRTRRSADSKSNGKPSLS